MEDSELRRELELLHRESYGWALCCCARDPGRAEEAVQEAYLKVLEGRARHDGRSGLKTWLFAVIRRTAADERRRDLLRRLRLWRYAPPPAADPRPDAAVGRSELADALRRALTSLPPRQEQVLQLLFYHDLSLSEAAAVMGVSLGSARTHYDRGKRAVRRRFEEQSDATEPGETREHPGPREPRSRATPGLVL